jgi:DNA-binding response OmpR family regulator
VKVLVAADLDPVRNLIAAVVSQAGHAVVSAGDGDTAWALFERERPQLVILDGELEGSDGLGLCRRIRRSEHGGETFVLVLTPRDESHKLRLVLDAGADDYVSKPVSPARLAARLTIAERRIAQEEARRRAEAALARAQWLAGIGETSIALQHEINNPLAALLGHVGLIENGLVDPGEEREVLAVVAEQAHRIAAVVKRLSALRNPQSVEYLRGGSRMIDLGEDAPASGKRG